MQMSRLALPAAELTYLEQIVRRVQQQFGAQLVGMYLFGSAASGAYEPGVSDLDVQAVVATQPPSAVCRTIADSLSHQALPCPARRLEFVLYTQAAVNPATRHPQFTINFNTGSAISDHLTLDPVQEASHWFLLDIAMGRACGRALLGPEPQHVFAPIPRLWQLEAIRDSLAWHQAHDADSANLVLNACRGWRYAVTNTLGSKQAGAIWANQQPDCAPVIAQAEARRRGGPPLNAAEVAAFNERIAAAVEAAIVQAS